MGMSRLGMFAVLIALGFSPMSAQALVKKVPRVAKTTKPQPKPTKRPPAPPKAPEACPWDADAGTDPLECLGEHDHD